MTIPILADENVDHRILHRLEHYGVDVVHVDFVAELDKGCSDDRIAAYSLETGRMILTNDDDFLSAYGGDEFAGVLFVENDSLAPSTVADIVNVIVGAVDDADGRVFYVSENWL